MKIFISHASKDIEIVKKFVEVLYHIGLNEENLFCSSVPELSVPEGKNIYDYLAELFQKEKIYVIFILSDNYYNSIYCLNEMGAAWVTKSEYTSILMPNFEYKEIKGPIDPMKASIKLNNELAASYLDSFKVKLQNMFEIKENFISDSRWQRYRDEFIINSCNEYLKALSIDLRLCRSICIGDDVSDGCVLNKNTLSENLVSVDLDFSKTEQNLCSLVIYPEVRDWRLMVEHHKHLQFEAISSNNIHITLEIKFKDTTYQLRKDFYIGTTYNTYQILLEDYGDDYDKWSNVIEICILTERKDCPMPISITIKNLKIK